MDIIDKNFDDILTYLVHAYNVVNMTLSNMAFTIVNLITKT
jgi:hypothetical protein